MYKKGDFGITNNYRDITLTSIAAKVYNVLLLSRIEPEINKKIPENPNGFRRKHHRFEQSVESLKEFE